MIFGQRSSARRVSRWSRVVLVVAVVILAGTSGVAAAQADSAQYAWTPTDHPNATVVPGGMRSDREPVPAGFSDEDADLAETVEAASRSSGRRDRADAQCQVYWPSPYPVCGAIRDKYNELGGPGSFLSFPKSDELANPDGVGKRTEFVNGPIYWSPQGGAHPVVNHFFAAWARNGWEAGPLGYPTSDEIVNPDGVGRRQHFESGDIYWKLNEAYAVRGAIRDKWAESGWEAGYLGYPASEEFVTPDGIGRGARFEHGMIYWTAAYGAHPVSGGLLIKWELSGYEKGPYGYPIADQQSRGSSWDQDFQFGTMGFPTDPVAAGDPDGADADPTVGDQVPVTWADFAADANTEGAGRPVIQDKTGTLEPCAAGQSCMHDRAAAVANDDPSDDPIIDGPDTQGTFISPLCLDQPWDGQWRTERKHACMIWNLDVDVIDTKGVEVGSIPFTVKTGVLTSHKSGEFQQEFRVDFHGLTGKTGKPTFRYKLAYNNAPAGSYSVDGADDGALIKSGQSKVIVVKWKQQAMADEALKYPVVNIAWNFGNLDPEIVPGQQWGNIRVANVRCDSTMKLSNGKFRQGCVYPGVTPEFKLTSVTTEQTWHVAEAIASGLPGSASRPLHRQADKLKRDINRQHSCPRRGPAADARRLTGRDCDEYPFASSYEGAAAHPDLGRTVHANCNVKDLPIVTGPDGYSVCMIDSGQNRRSGSLLGKFYGEERVVDQDKFSLATSGGASPGIP